MDTFVSCVVISVKRGNFCSFLFVLLHTKSILKCVYFSFREPKEVFEVVYSISRKLNTNVAMSTRWAMVNAHRNYFARFGRVVKIRKLEFSSLVSETFLITGATLFGSKLLSPTFFISRYLCANSKIVLYS